MEPDNDVINFEEKRQRSIREEKEPINFENVNLDNIMQNPQIPDYPPINQYLSNQPLYFTIYFF